MGVPLTDKSKLHGNAGNKEPQAWGRNNKRQQIIYLQENISKRNRKGESTITSLETHGKILSAEGRMVNKTSTGNRYQDFKEFHRSSFQGLSAEKDKGPPEIRDTARAKNDAYEVVSEQDKGHVKVVHENHEHLAASGTAGDEVLEEKHGAGTGLHIVSLNKEKPAVDKDESVYRTIDSRPLESISQIRQSSPNVAHTINSVKYNVDHPHENHNNNDFFPSSVVSLSEDQIMQMPRHSYTERSIYSSPSLREAVFHSHLSGYPYRFDEVPRRFWRRRRKHFRARYNRPSIYFVPVYSREDQPEINPFTPQAPFGFYGQQPQKGYAEDSSRNFADDQGFRRQLVVQPMFRMPVLPTQGNPLYLVQIDGQNYPLSQDPQIRSPILQLQPAVQPTQTLPVLPQQTEPEPLIVPQSSQMLPSPFQEQQLQSPPPQSRWADSPGYSRSEILNNEEPSEEGKEERADRPGSDRNDGFTAYDTYKEEDNYVGKQKGYSRESEPYSDEDQAREYEEQEDEDRTDEGEEDEQTEEDPEEEDTIQENLNHNDVDEESDPGEAISNDLEPLPGSERLKPESYTGGTYSSMQRENRFPENDVKGLEVNPEEKNYRLMSRIASMDPILDREQNEAADRYKMMNTHSNPTQEPLLWKDQDIHKPAQSQMEISEMSAAQAHFLQNQERRDPTTYIGPVSKNTIPRKAKDVTNGLENVLIRLNGKPLEDSADLRSKIIDGKVVQGKGKLVKSKGPVDVKISHTKDAKHTKVIDIVSPQKYNVYDTRSNIAKPALMIIPGKRTDNAYNLSRT